MQKKTKFPTIERITKLFSSISFKWNLFYHNFILWLSCKDILAIMASVDIFMRQHFPNCSVNYLLKLKLRGLEYTLYISSIYLRQILSRGEVTNKEATKSRFSGGRDFRDCDCAHLTSRGIYVCSPDRERNSQYRHKYNPQLAR